MFLLFLFRQQEQLQRNWHTVTSRDTYFHSAYSAFYFFIYIEVQTGSDKILERTLSFFFLLCFFPKTIFSFMKKSGTLKNQKKTPDKQLVSIYLHFLKLIGLL